MKKFVITVNRIRLASPHSKSYAAQCPACCRTVELVALGEACEIVGAGLDEVVAQAAAGKLHLGIRPEALLICLDSLLAANFAAAVTNRFAESIGKFKRAPAAIEKIVLKKIF